MFNKYVYKKKMLKIMKMSPVLDWATSILNMHGWWSRDPSNQIWLGAFDTQTWFCKKEDGLTVIPTLAKKNHVWARWGKFELGTAKWWLLLLSPNTAEKGHTVTSSLNHDRIPSIVRTKSCDQVQEDGYDLSQ